MCRRLRGDLAFLERASGITHTSLPHSRARARQEAKRARKQQRCAQLNGASDGACALKAQAAAQAAGQTDDADGEAEGQEHTAHADVQVSIHTQQALEPMQVQFPDHHELHTQADLQQTSQQRITPSEQDASQQPPSAHLQDGAGGTAVHDMPQAGIASAQHTQENGTVQTPQQCAMAARTAEASPTQGTAPTPAAAGDGSCAPAGCLSVARAQGILNNLRGFQGELTAALVRACGRAGTSDLLLAGRVSIAYCACPGAQQSDIIKFNCCSLPACEWDLRHTALQLEWMHVSFMLISPPNITLILAAHFARPNCSCVSVWWLCSGASTPCRAPPPRHLGARPQALQPRGRGRRRQPRPHRRLRV